MSPTNGAPINSSQQLTSAGSASSDVGVVEPHNRSYSDLQSSEQQVPTAEMCVSMEDVRAGIDELDKKLVALLAMRTQYIEAAARIKETHDDVRVQWRIEDVLAKVGAEAERVGVPKSIVVEGFRAVIEESIAHEGRVWRALRGLSENNDG
ncbi:MAG: chorismate mutase [Pseudomonadota bacterium]